MNPKAELGELVELQGGLGLMNTHSLVMMMGVSKKINNSSSSRRRRS